METLWARLAFMAYEFDPPLSQTELDDVEQHIVDFRKRLDWDRQSRRFDPMIELAANRQLPPGHVVFLGDKALQPPKPQE